MTTRGTVPGDVLTLTVRAQPDVHGVVWVRLQQRNRTTADLLVVAVGQAPREWECCGDVLCCLDAVSPIHADELIGKALEEYPGAEAAICAFPAGCAAGMCGTEVRRWWRQPSAPAPWHRWLRSLSGGRGEFGSARIPDGGIELASFGEMVACFLVMATVQLEAPERGQ
ncbi:hypothetical protein SAMN04489730_4056 [Amycolatopsis australiensis]|uniref:Uncharacterized protein n=1 Tax=Amycolatopsis australiensis TaxID=546364 RepID=A0A1K1RVY7_9PSEU|nr:hypothetical protein SAMN04489730_4056 [Amycolatopsis australiensis]